MSDRKRATRRAANSSDIADLFKVLRCMAFDDEVTDGDFRIAYRVAQAVDQDTGWAEIGTACLSDEVRKTDKKKVAACRKRVAAAGWWVMKPAKGRTATRYRFLAAKVDGIQAKIDAARGKREEAFHLDQIDKRTGLKADAMGVNFGPSTGEIIDASSARIPPRKTRRTGGKSAHAEGGELDPILPQCSTSEDSLSVQEMSQDAMANTHVPARAGVRKCSDCFLPAVIHEKGTGRFWCSECAEDRGGRLIQPVVIEIDRTEPPPNDMAGNYRAASRG